MALVDVYMAVPKYGTSRCMQILIFCIYILSRGVDSHPLGGFLNLLKKNTPSGAQVVINGSSSQPINVGDDTNVAIAEDLFASILINAF